MKWLNRLTGKDKLQEKLTVIENLNHELLSRLSTQTKTCEKQQDQIINLASNLRETDQLIFQMSQQMSWHTMRPYFNELQEICMKRQREESNRITGIMQKELISVYTGSDQITIKEP